MERHVATPPRRYPAPACPGHSAAGARLLHGDPQVQLQAASRHPLHRRMDEAAHVLNRVRRVRGDVRRRRLAIRRVDVELRLLETEEIAQP